MQTFQIGKSQNGTAGVLLTAVIFFVKNDTFLCYIAWDYAFVGTRLFWGVERLTENFNGLLVGISGVITR